MVLWNLKSVQFVYLQNFNTLCLDFFFIFYYFLVYFLHIHVLKQLFFQDHFLEYKYMKGHLLNTEITVTGTPFDIR